MPGLKIQDFVHHLLQKEETSVRGTSFSPNQTPAGVPVSCCLLDFFCSGKETEDDFSS